MSEGFTRAKRYIIKRLSGDGLLRTPENKWGDNAFAEWGYESEECAWRAIERHVKNENEGSRYLIGADFIVLKEWRVARAPQGGQDE